MLRSLASRVNAVVCSAIRANARQTVVATQVRHKHELRESSDEFDDRYVSFFSREDIDGWDIRQAMNDLQGLDVVPEPKIIIAAMQACRRVNDYALAVRYLEAVQEKCGNQVDKVWPYLYQEIAPTLSKLGILTPHEMGYGAPELAIVDVSDIN